MQCSSGVLAFAPIEKNLRTISPFSPDDHKWRMKIGRHLEVPALFAEGREISHTMHLEERSFVPPEEWLRSG
jgi:hypothetical protein